MKKELLIVILCLGTISSVLAQSYDIWTDIGKKDDFDGTQTNQITIEYYNVDGFKAVHLTFAEMIKPDGSDFVFFFAIPGQFDLGPLSFKTGTKIRKIDAFGSTHEDYYDNSGVVSTFTGIIDFDPKVLWKYSDPILMRIGYEAFGKNFNLDLTLPQEFKDKALKFMTHH